ncbi:uncharacterized protein [Triticum aestivum]|uniref:uncharacterized protein n=1 Tax=Triticum aestivum TaxID=4565 RepID=UPI001D01CC44|nr:uncharacterized protein LOC123191624 [Triticum aestivum]
MMPRVEALAADRARLEAVNALQHESWPLGGPRRSPPVAPPQGCYRTATLVCCTEYRTPNSLKSENEDLKILYKCELENEELKIRANDREEEEDARQRQNQRVGSGRGLRRHGCGGSSCSRRALCPAPARRALPLWISSNGGRFWHVPQVQNEEDLCLHSPSGEQMDFCTPLGQHHRVSS